MSYDITCPYCNYEFDDEDFGENNPNELYELECPECEKIMMVQYELWPSFSVTEAPCKNGEDHELVEIHGCPEEIFEHQRRCKWCDETFIIDKEKHEKSIQDYFKKLSDKYNLK